MMTTLRSDRRTRRNAMFNLECLDERIVLSAASAVAARGPRRRPDGRGENPCHREGGRCPRRDEARLEKIEARQRQKASYDSPPPHPDRHRRLLPGDRLDLGVPSTSSAAPTAIVNSTATASRPTTATARPIDQHRARPPADDLHTSHPRPATTTTSSSTTTTTSTPLPTNASAPLQSLYSQYESLRERRRHGDLLADRDQQVRHQRHQRRDQFPDERSRRLQHASRPPERRPPGRPPTPRPTGSSMACSRSPSSPPSHRSPRRPACRR